MRIKHKIIISITDDTEGKDKLFDLDEELAEIDTEAFAKCVSGRFEIAASSNENLSFGDVSDVRAVYVKADNDFNVKFNGGTEVFNIKRASTSHPAKMFLEIDTTAVNLVNPSATAALKGTWCA